MGEGVHRRTGALEAARQVGNSLGVPCHEAHVIKDSNNTIIHLAPTPIAAKVGTTTIRSDASAILQRELRIGRYLADHEAPIAPPTEDVDPGPHVVSEHVITLWRFIEITPDSRLDDAALGQMLNRFHAALADYPGDLPDFREALDRARITLEDPSETPRMDSRDRAFLLDVAKQIEYDLQGRVLDRHPLHGDPHLDGNILIGVSGPVLIDFETACLGPYEWDLTSLGRAEVGYPDADADLLSVLSRMRSLTVSTWCWMQYGRAPEVDEAAHVHLRLLRDNLPAKSQRSPR